MLEALGLETLDELFTDIPSDVRVKGIPLARSAGEQEVVERLQAVLAKNRTTDVIPSFLGAGAYDHYIPAAVDSIVGRSEFYTAYTPYQAEVSQGLLQALWEYQSLICVLTGMDAANSSLYDGSTALGEAALMSARITGKREFLIPRALHWERRAVLENYASGPGLKLKEVEYDRSLGSLDLHALRDAISPDTAGVYVESPNFLGVFEEALGEIRDLTKEAVLVVGSNPLALAIAKPPGDLGADIVVGEGQPLGLSLSYGGPYLGIFACRREHIRKMPGRVIGLTHDAEGRRAFCMTLQTREQHIRRDKAMSNICTNEALAAIAAAAFMALHGGQGLQNLAWRNVRAARELMSLIGRVKGFTAPAFKGSHFNEFVVRGPASYAEIDRHLLERGIQGGLGLGDRLPELRNAAVFAATERHARAQFEALAKALGDWK